MQVALPTKRRLLGFTLIEAMITVAIVAILGGLAYPNYVAYITRSRIIDGTSKLSDFRVRMEQYFMDNRTYVGPAPPGVGTCGASSGTSATDKFRITVCNATATTFTAQAIGLGAMAGFTYQINETNNHVTVAVPAGWNTANAANCWIVKKDGSC